MKKYGIINPYLMGALAGLKHLDTFALVDVGMPIPKGMKVIDLTIIPGVPEFLPVLHIILEEVTVEAYAIFDTMKKYNPTVYDEITHLLARQEKNEYSFDEWFEKSREAHFFVRTAELLPNSNILLRSAPVQEMFRKKYDIV